MCGTKGREYRKVYTHTHTHTHTHTTNNLSIHTYHPLSYINACTV